MNEHAIVTLDACGSTQDEVATRLAGAAPGTLVAMRSATQLAGRGREGRSWQDTPGAALLVSVGVRGPLPVAVLDELPARLGRALLATLGASGRATWKAPNDLVAVEGGAKLAGILVDARTLGAHVEQVVVGIGCNVAGAAFTTSDGRAATSLEALLGAAPDVDELARGVVDAVARELSCA